MNKVIVTFLLIFIVFHSMVCRTAVQTNPIVLMKTELGDIIIEVYSKKAPLTAQNFMRYVDEDRFKNASFYRVVRPDNQPENEIMIEVIQGGIGFVESDLRLAPIAHESTDRTGIIHADGVISMARAEPGTASSEFFICIGDQPALDFGGRRNPDGAGFAAFGRVVEGMDIVREIQGREADGQMLKMPVRINDIKRMVSKERT